MAPASPRLYSLVELVGIRPSFVNIVHLEENVWCRAAIKRLMLVDVVVLAGILQLGLNRREVDTNNLAIEMLISIVKSPKTCGKVIV